MGAWPSPSWTPDGHPRRPGRVERLCLCISPRAGAVAWDTVNATGSVYEVNVRALGGLLSAHGPAADRGRRGCGVGAPPIGTPTMAAGCCGWRRAWATGRSSRLRRPRACRTGPWCLRRGVAPGETTEASVAGRGGTYVLELGTLRIRLPWPTRPPNQLTPGCRYGQRRRQRWRQRRRLQQQRRLARLRQGHAPIGDACARRRRGRRRQ